MINISKNVREKLWSKHQVIPAEVEECFANRDGGFLIDTRERNRTNPPTRWFISETNGGRRLKVVFMHFPVTGEIRIKTAFEPNEIEESIYGDQG